MTRVKSIIKYYWCKSDSTYHNLEFKIHFTDLCFAKKKTVTTKSKAYLKFIGYDKSRKKLEKLFSHVWTRIIALIEVPNLPFICYKKFNKMGIELKIGLAKSNKGKTYSTRKINFICQFSTDRLIQIKTNLSSWNKIILKKKNNGIEAIKYCNEIDISVLIALNRFSTRKSGLLVGTLL